MDICSIAKDKREKFSSIISQLWRVSQHYDIADDDDNGERSDVYDGGWWPTFAINSILGCTSKSVSSKKDSLHAYQPLNPCSQSLVTNNITSSPSHHRITRSSSQPTITISTSINTVLTALSGDFKSAYNKLEAVAKKHPHPLMADSLSYFKSLGQILKIFNILDKVSIKHHTYKPSAMPSSLPPLPSLISHHHRHWNTIINISITGCFGRISCVQPKLLRRHHVPGCARHCIYPTKNKLHCHNSSNKQCQQWDHCCWWKIWQVGVDVDATKPDGPTTNCCGSERGNW